MCKAVEDMNNNARQDGKQEGLMEGHLETLRDAVKNVMESFHLSMEDVMNGLNVSKEDRPF